MRRRTMLGWMGATALGGAWGGEPARAKERGLLLKSGQKVLFLGDSITNAGTWVQFVDAYLRLRFPNRKFELYNLGLSSEGVTGLSEPDHPFPRPNVHERLGRALARIKPDVVVACYGMNDGIYYPLAPERFEQYQQGIRKLVSQSREAGASVILMTSPPFDPVPVKGKLLPGNAPKFSWVNPYERYNDVLGRYAEWLLTLRKEGLTVIDTRTPTMRFLEAAQRKDPAYNVAGDGVHPNPAGHALIALAFLEAINAPAEIAVAEIDARKLKAQKGAIRQLRREGQGIEFEWTVPGPWLIGTGLDPRLQEIAHLNDRLSRFRLVVKGLSAARYTLVDGDRMLGEVTAAELAAGVDMLQFLDHDDLTLRTAREGFFKAIRERERLLSPAWLTAVGHQRPSTPAGLPLDEAQKRAAQWDPALFVPRLTERRTLRLGIMPVG